MLDYDFEPLPPYTDPRAVLRAVLPSLRPAEQISVTDAAERDMRVSVGGAWQPFRRDVAPYMIEPTDMIASRSYAALVFCGPSQSGKTLMLQSALSHTITSDPGRVALFQMTREAAAQFERDKIAPMLRNSPKLRERMSAGRGANNQYQKLFTGGTQLTIDWPTITKLSSATIRLVLGTDYDHFRESIDGEGDAFTLMRARTRSFMSRGMVVVESSPGAPIIDESWRADSVHDCPPVRYGVLSIYPQGTRARWYWQCPEGCGAEFEPRFDRLRWPEGASIDEASQRVEMMCPGCGALFGHEHKRSLNAAGRWLHESADGTRGVPLGDPDIRKTDTLTYWLNGAAAAFATWGQLVTQHLQAVDNFERTGDEEKLRSIVNTGLGQPYLPRSGAEGSEVSLQVLKDKQTDTETPKRLAPSWSRYLTVSIDTQVNRFDVSIIAWGEDGKHQPIDRFDIHVPPAEAPNAEDRTVRPFDVAEDWAALEPLADMVWNVEGQGYGLRPLALGVDMQGGGATTPNAYAFYRGRRAAGQGRMWYLTRGSGGEHTDRVWLKAPERARSGRRVAKDIEILHMATDRLKDAVASSLRLRDVGQNICLIPSWMEEAHLIELTAERRGLKGWDKRPGMVRNEAFDHLVQARALNIILRAEKIDWTAPPSWALGGAENSHAVMTDGKAASTAATEKKADASEFRRNRRPSPGGWIKKRENWF